MGTVVLPSDPRESDYEDLVAACLTSLGYFTETRLVLRSEKVDVLELDVVATPSDARYLDRTLFEAKSGSWGIGDIFKLSGQMNYLQLRRGELIHPGNADARRLAAAVRVSGECGITCRPLSMDTLKSLQDPGALPSACVAMQEDLRRKVITTAWFGRIADRLVQAEFTRQCKGGAEGSAFAAARQHAQLVAESFFRKTPIARATALYEAYQQNPRVSGSLVAEITASRGSTENSVMTAAWNSSEHLVVQHALALEHRARLAIVKNALDEAFEREVRTPTPPPTTPEQAFWRLIFETAQPASLRRGIDAIAISPNRTRLPYLFQAFIELFGGFYFDTPEDLGLISAVTGVPQDQVIPSLRMLDLFFPAKSGWFYEGTGDLTWLKLVPGYLRGVGAYMRLRAFDLQDYGERYGSNSFALGRWHDALYGVVQPYLRPAPQAAPAPPVATPTA